MDDSGNLLVSHYDKANLIWLSFKERLGTTIFTTLNYDLASHFAAPPDLTVFVTPFTKLEIDSVVRSLPPDKAPGPDGFNNNFIKSCWHFIKDDFYALCTDFQENLVCLQSINDSFITLIPKIDGA